MNGRREAQAIAAAEAGAAILHLHARRPTDGGVSIASGLTGNEKVVVLAGAFLNVGDKVKLQNGNLVQAD